MLASLVDPSQPANTYVNFISKSIATSTLCLVYYFLPLNDAACVLGTLADT